MTIDGATVLAVGGTNLMTAGWSRSAGAVMLAANLITIVLAWLTRRRTTIQ
jgi:hypothetical protein